MLFGSRAAAPELDLCGLQSSAQLFEKRRTQPARAQLSSLEKIGAELGT
jgi:hypothetical protein